MNIKIKYLIIAKYILENNIQDKSVRYIKNVCKCGSDTVRDAKKFLIENPNISIKEINEIIYKV